MKITAICVAVATALVFSSAAMAQTDVPAAASALSFNPGFTNFKSGANSACYDLGNGLASSSTRTRNQATSTRLQWIPAADPSTRTRWS